MDLLWSDQSSNDNTLPLGTAASGLGTNQPGNRSAGPPLPDLVTSFAGVIGADALVIMLPCN
jgi:hypothetical protein